MLNPNIDPLKSTTKPCLKMTMQKIQATILKFNIKYDGCKDKFNQANL